MLDRRGVEIKKGRRVQYRCKIVLREKEHGIHHVRGVGGHTAYLPADLPTLKGAPLEEPVELQGVVTRLGGDEERVGVVFDGSPGRCTIQRTELEVLASAEDIKADDEKRLGWRGKRRDSMHVSVAAE